MKLLISTLIFLLELQLCSAQCQCTDSTTFVDLSSQSKPKYFNNTSDLIKNNLKLGDEFNESRIILFFDFTIDCVGNVINFDYGDKGMKDSLLFQKIKDVVMHAKWTPGKFDNINVCERRRHSINTNSKEYTILTYSFGLDSKDHLYKK